MGKVKYVVMRAIEDVFGPAYVVEEKGFTTKQTAIDKANSLKEGTYLVGVFVETIKVAAKKPEKEALPQQITAPPPLRTETNRNSTPEPSHTVVQTPATELKVAEEGVWDQT